MSRIASTAGLLGSTAVLAAAALIAGAAAQPASPPDFSSNQTAWQGSNGVNFIAVPGSPPLVTNDPAYPHVPNGRGQQPTYRIADLTNPNLKQWAKDVMKKDNDEVLKGKIAFTPGSSCVPGGVPSFMLDGGPFFFIQTPKEVMLINQGDQQTRHIYLNVPHSANVKPSWFGEAVGHYEGDTLVVDTIAQNTKTFVDQFRTPHTEKLHVVERWRMIEEGKTLEVLVTIDDPDTFHQPWQGILRWGRVQRTLPEEVCAEGNFVLFDYGTPVADKPDF
jgi:hypothetical protein